jgi:MFS family permease
LLCAAAGSVTELAVCRAVQGMGGGGLASLAMTVIADVTTLRERGRYQGFYTAVFGTAALAGPVVGGVLAGQDRLLGVAGWRWMVKPWRAAGTRPRAGPSRCRRRRPRAARHRGRRR